MAEHPVLPPYDALDDALSDLRPRGAFLYRSELTAPWGLTAGYQSATFHIVESGACLLEADDGAAVTLEAGDLAVLPRGGTTAFRDAPTTPVLPVETLLARNPPDATGILRGGGGGPATALVCGGIAFDAAVPHPILDVLPPVLVLRQRRQGGAPWLQHTVRFLTCESRRQDPGAMTIMGHLGSVLFVQAVRTLLNDGAAEERFGWLSALHDPHVGQALRMILQAPEQPWTVEALGQEVGLGRSAFAARFNTAVGEPPMQHVTRWRMYRASHLLQRGATLAEAAGGTGYASEAAFSRAFKRWTGHPPSAVRQAA